MNEMLTVIFNSCMLATTLYQILGFITPSWMCKWPDNVTEICDHKGLFYNCTDGGCNPNVLDNSAFVICLVSLIISCLTTAFMLKISYGKISSGRKLNWNLECSNVRKLAKCKWTKLKAERMCVAFHIFIVGQLLAGAGFIILAILYDDMGWSGLSFFVFSVPLTIICFGIVVICFYLLGLFCVYVLICKCDNRTVAPQN